MYKWTKLYPFKVNQKPKIYQFLILLGYLFILDIAFADSNGPHIETTTIFNNCSSGYNNTFNDIENIIYQEEFEIQQELVYQPCGISCYQSGKRRKCYDNSYLQDKLDPNNLNPSYEDQELNRSLDPRCTYRVLKIAGDTSGKFLDCDSFNDPNPEEKHQSEKPCFSKRLHHAVHQSITEISSCFRIDPKLFFSIMANESKLHPLAKNSTSTATGPGQITSGYIDQYSNQSRAITFDTLKREVLPVLSRQNTDCRIVQDKIAQFSKLEKRPICQRTNHYVNMIYTMMGLMDSISQLTPLVIRGQRSSFRISPDSPFGGLTSGYGRQLGQVEARGSKAQNLLRNARGGGGDGEFRVHGRTAQQKKEVQELEAHVALNQSQERSLRGKKRLFENLARFQELNANDRKLVSELSIYWYMLPRTKELFQTYVEDRRPLAFEDFTGPNGEWVNFLSTDGMRGQINNNKKQQDYFIGYVYNLGETSSGSSSMMHGLLNRIEQKQPPIPYRCRPY